MNSFSGIVTSRGILALATHPETSTPEEHVDCQVLMRGYVADRADLGRSLQLEDSSRISDAKLLSCAFRKWGRSLQAHVLGEFAAVIFDMQTRTALLTHDSFGLVPLFYSRKPDGLVFSTDILDILDLKSSEALDEEYLADVISVGFITGERTPYSAVRRLLPGRSLCWSDGHFKEIETWNLADAPPVRCASDFEYEEQFRSLLEAGVQASLDLQGVTWIALSGGLDSSSIACIAARSGARGLAAYSIVSPRWPHADEQKWMKAVVDLYGLPWHRVDVENMLPFGRLPKNFYGEPAGAAICEDQMQVENELFRAHGVTAVLNGFGGDDVLGRSPGRVPVHLADPLFDGEVLAALHGVASWRAGSKEDRSYSYWLLRALIEPAMDHVRGLRVRRRHLRLSWPPWLRRDYVATMALDKRVRKQVAPRCRHPGRQALWTSLWLQSLELATLPYHHMSHESRNPLVYRPLVEFMYGIPWEQILRPRCDRYLQRRALKGILPELIRRRATKGSGNPALVEGLRRSPDWIDYLCDRSMMAERGIADLDLWRQAVRQASVGQTHDDRFFMAGVTMEVWLRRLEEWRRQKRERPFLQCASLGIPRSLKPHCHEHLPS